MLPPMGPLKFIPLLKRIRWGGRRLGDVLGKSIGVEADYAESWEICDLSADQTLIAAGEFAGSPLRKLMQEHSPELLGRHSGESEFPLLIKFLDARDRLSVQVHPDDDLAAAAFIRGGRGKTEAWVILAAEPGSRVFAGLKPGVTAASLRQHLDRGRVAECLHEVEVSAGDCLYIPAGTVHAIGEGILLAEVQQSSNVTFRLFDWNRVGGDGKLRELHIEQSLTCIDFARGPVHPVVPTPLLHAGPESELLASCPYFTIHRHVVERPLSFPDDNRCRIVIALEGTSECVSSGERHHVRKGETILIPAAGHPATLEPQPRAVVLEVFW
ncbi:MAG TPA: type I phosphomannose isomerase catalytic subunit [Planctomycetaceae bacterium]